MSDANKSDWADRVLSEIDPAQIDEVNKLGEIPGLTADEAAKALTEFFASIPDEYFLWWDMVTAGVEKEEPHP